MTKEAEVSKEEIFEQFKSVMDISAIALRSAMVVNGAAALSLLTFMGNSKLGNQMPFFVCALQYYVIGVALAAFATGTSYCAQYRYLHELKKHKYSKPVKPIGRYFTYLSILLVFSSFLMFVLGGFSASQGFSNQI